MSKLKEMYGDYLGTVEFKCDYFTIDKKTTDEINRMLESGNDTHIPETLCNK